MPTSEAETYSANAREFAVKVAQAKDPLVIQMYARLANDHAKLALNAAAARVSSDVDEDCACSFRRSA